MSKQLRNTLFILINVGRMKKLDRTIFLVVVYALIHAPLVILLALMLYEAMKR